MNLQSQDYLAKLLSKENLTVQHGNFQTASFNVVDRILSLPLWADKGKAVYDLLVGHEVGHALYTPADGWHDSDKEIPGVPRSMINIIEDIRIEKMIQRTYPGIVRSFKQGYKKLFDDNIFGTVDKDLTKYGFMDKLNIHSKGRGYAEVSFDDTEQMFVDLAMGVETWDDVLNACSEINDFLANREDYEEDNNEKEIDYDDSETDGSTSAEQNEAGSQMEASDDQCEEDEGTPSDSGFDESESLTDEAQRNNESKLLDTNEQGKQPVYCNGLDKTAIDHMVTKYKDVRATRLEYAPEVYNLTFDRADLIEDEYSKFMKSSKKTVMAMAREFERKKAAFEYSRSQTAKKGSLDVNKLHQYQYSEDIFKTVTKLAEAKSHGLVVAIDWSGSMNRIVEDVVKQSLILAQFCKRVNIPFEIYSFTSGDNTLPGSYLKVPGGMYSSERTKVVEVINGTMKKNTFQEAMKHLFIAATVLGNNEIGYRTWVNSMSLSKVDRMGGTPLIETTMILTRLVNNFTARTGIQNANIIIMTDGDANYIDVSRTYDDDNVIDYYDLDTSEVVVNFNGTMVRGKGTEDLYNICVNEMKRQTNSTAMCLFLATDKFGFTTARHKMGLGNGNRYDDPTLADDYKSYNNDGVFTKSNVAGYDEFTIVKVGSRKSVEEFEVKDNKNGNDIAIKDIKKQFRSFSKGKKATKKLVTTITDTLVA